MSDQTQSDRLNEILEAFGVERADFEKLRADSYEKSLARHSLELLEHFYSELLKPGQKEADARENCPPWPPGTQRAGQLPSSGAISQVKSRLMTRSTLNSLGQVSAFLEKIRGRAKAMQIGNSGEVLETLTTMIGEEMIQEKLSGGKVTENLEPVNLLLSHQSAKTKAEFEKQKIEIRREANVQANQRFEQAKYEFEFDAAKAVLANLAELRTISGNRSLNEDEKIEQVRLRLWGAPPKEMEGKA